MDPLSDIVALLRPHAAVSKPITGRGKWGVRYATYGLPGFAIVLSGHCWLAIDGREPLRLDKGDFVLFPSTPAFSLFSQPGVNYCVYGNPADTGVRHGEKEGEPDFRMLGGAFHIEKVNAPLLISLLPAIIHVRSSDGSSGRIGNIIGLIMEECASDHPGQGMVLERLLEVMLMEALRWQTIREDILPSGFLSGMRDPLLARALAAMHSDARAKWTVAELARLAGMSRSAFAERFGQAIGCTPMDYLYRWRMALARDALCRGGKSLDRIADEIGYESASAFSTAFRRREGCAPGAFARSRQAQSGARRP